MRLDTVVDYPQTAEIWVIVGQDPNTEQFFYEYQKETNIKFTSRPDVRTPVAICKDELAIGMHLRNVRDPNGKELIAKKRWYVNSVTPQTNVFGYVEGYSYNLTAGGFDS